MPQRSYRAAALPAAASVLPPIALSRTRALDDSDGATRQTVEKMCELIRESATDPLVQQCAAYARDRFAMGSTDQAALAWGVFWYVKHCVKFRLDEGTMLQIGESHDAFGQQQQDLLIAPGVLVRMRNPSEDCDGFTMLTAALLTCLGVQVLIATVAVDMDDPSRWSHVFLCAIINGRVKPLDTSHGTAPGWMVPRNRINRWQTWTLDGRPADVSIPTYQGLHEYKTFPPIGGLGRLGATRSLRVPRIRIAKRGRGFGGLGCDCSDVTTDPTTGDTFCNDPDPCVATGSGEGGTEGSNLPSGTSVSDAACPSGYWYENGTCTTYTCPSGSTYTGGGICTSGSGATTPGTKGATATPNYAAMVSAIAAAAGQDIRAVIQQPQALLQAQTWANISAYLPIIGIGVLGVMLISSLGGKK